MKGIIIFLSVAFISLSVASGQATGISQEEKSITESDAGRQITKGKTTGALRLFGEKNDLTTVIMIIPLSSEVEVVQRDGDYYLVNYDDYQGYVVASKIVITQLPDKKAGQQAEQEIVRQQQAVEQNQQSQQQDINRMTYLENKYGARIAGLLYSGRIWKGMTSDMVEDSWGSPSTINRVIVRAETVEEWIYHNTWLLIERGRLSDWGPVRK